MKSPNIESHYIDFSKTYFYYYENSFTVFTLKLILLSEKVPMCSILIHADIRPIGYKLSYCGSFWSRDKNLSPKCILGRCDVMHMAVESFHFLIYQFVWIQFFLQLFRSLFFALGKSLYWLFIPRSGTWQLSNSCFLPCLGPAK